MKYGIDIYIYINPLPCPTLFSLSYRTPLYIYITCMHGRERRDGAALNYLHHQCHKKKFYLSLSFQEKADGERRRRYHFLHQIIIRVPKWVIN